MHSGTIRPSSWLAAALALCGGLGLTWATARGDELSAHVTSVIGDARAGSAHLAEHGIVGERERVTMGEDGKCSMLVDGYFVIQICERTTVVLHRDPERGRRIIQVDAGSARVIAEPRLAEQRIEIHTPAAIVTLLGTIVHVTVDATTGDSTIASINSAVRVRSSNHRFEQETTLHAAERITVRRGAPPPAQTRRLGPQEMAELSSCAADLREAALRPGRDELVDGAIRRLAESEVSRLRSLELGPLAPDRPEPPPESDPPGEAPSDLGEICTPIDCGHHRLSPQRPPRRAIAR